jgi:hypothetical protein
MGRIPRSDYFIRRSPTKHGQRAPSGRNTVAPFSSSSTTSRSTTACIASQVGGETISRCWRAFRKIVLAGAEACAAIWVGNSNGTRGRVGAQNSSWSKLLGRNWNLKKSIATGTHNSDLSIILSGGWRHRL